MQAKEFHPLYGPRDKPFPQEVVLLRRRAFSPRQFHSTEVSTLPDPKAITDLLKKSEIRTSSGITLVPFTKFHHLLLARLYYYWFTNPLITQFLLPTTPKSYDEIDKWIREVQQDESTAYHVIYPSEKNITSPNYHEFIGHVGLRDITPYPDSSAEISCVITQNFWNLELARESVGAIMYNSQEFIRTFTATHVRNPASWRLLDILKFKLVQEENGYRNYEYRQQ